MKCMLSKLAGNSFACPIWLCKSLTLLADCPAVFFHICNFDICQLSRAIYYNTMSNKLTAERRKKMITNWEIWVRSSLIILFPLVVRHLNGQNTSVWQSLSYRLKYELLCRCLIKWHLYSLIKRVFIQCDNRPFALNIDWKNSVCCMFQIHKVLGNSSLKSSSIYSGNHYILQQYCLFIMLWISIVQAKEPL